MQVKIELRSKEGDKLWFSLEPLMTSESLKSKDHAGLHIVTCKNLAIFVNHGLYTNCFKIQEIYVTIRNNIVIQQNFMILTIALLLLFVVVEDC